MVPDQLLIQQALEGDQKSWNTLIERYRGLVYSVPHHAGLPPEGCEDVFQACFLALVRNLSRVRDAKSLPKWLVTTASRESWRWSRRHRREAPHVFPEPTSEDVSLILERAELQTRLLPALEALGGKCERLLRALFLTSAPPAYSDISRELEIPIGSIGPTRNRCLAKLLQQFDPALSRNPS